MTSTYSLGYGGRFCIFIENIEFPTNTLQSRKDVQGNVDKVKKLFHDELKFKLEHFKNQTAQKIKTILSDIRNVFKDELKDDESLSCFALFISSHGRNGSIHGSDGKDVTYGDINESLENNDCLKGKPKIIYINACRNKDTCDLFGSFKTPDMFVMLSTRSGFYSHGNIFRGTRFIDALCTVYNRNETINFPFLAVDINHEMLRYDSTVLQQAVCVSTLKKRLIIFHEIKK